MNLRDPGAFAAFLARINEEPAEDTHRAVLADWLEENEPGGDGPALASLLRGADPADPTRRPAVLEAFRGALRGPWTLCSHPSAFWDDAPPSAGALLGLSRGLPGAARLPANGFLAAAAGLAGRWPVTHLEVEDANARLRDRYRDGGPTLGLMAHRVSHDRGLDSVRRVPVPDPVFDEMQRRFPFREGGPHTSYNFLYFASPSRFRAAFSAAAVAWARAYNGLPPLPEPVPEPSDPAGSTI